MSISIFVLLGFLKATEENPAAFTSDLKLPQELSIYSWAEYDKFDCLLILDTEIYHFYDNPF